jgi:HAD superfamily hydrolase (TIGR01509 family)
MQLRCVLFDHDDTLLPTFDLRARVLREAALEVLGKELDAVAFLTASHGRNLEQMSGDLTDGDDALAARVVTAYRARYYAANRHGLTPYPGIRDVLGALRAAGIRVGVVTSKLGTGARDELANTDLARHIEHLTGAEDVRAHKPAPEPLRRAMTALGVSPGETLMVGDTAADILGARAAGTASAAALWGARDREGLLALVPDHALEHPAGVLELIEARASQSG